MKKILSKLAPLSLISIAVILTGCTQIDTGNVGVERTLGKVGKDALPPGVYFTAC